MAKPTNMRRGDEWARDVPARSVPTFQKMGFEVVDGSPEDEPSPPPPPGPEPFAFDALELDELKAHFLKARGAGVDLPVAPGRAGVKWYSETLSASGWSPEEAEGDGDG